MITDKWIFGNEILKVVSGLAFFPSIVYLRETYKKIAWVRETIDDLHKLLKDIVGNRTVQAIFFIGILLIFLGAIIIPIIQMIIMLFS